MANLIDTQIAVDDNPGHAVSLRLVKSCSLRRKITCLLCWWCSCYFRNAVLYLAFNPVTARSKSIDGPPTRTNITLLRSHDAFLSNDHLGKRPLVPPVHAQPTIWEACKKICASPLSGPAEGVAIMPWWTVNGALCNLASGDFLQRFFGSTEIRKFEGKSFISSS